MKNLIKASVFAGGGMMIATAAQAHTGVGTTAGFASGFAHPLFGADHLLAMVAVGLWAALQGGRALWAVPLAFVGAMVAGGAFAMAGGALPAVEIGIAGSVLALGALVAWNPRLHTGVAMAIVAAFAVFHGHAHGTEMPSAASGLLYGLGFALATAALHGAGIGLGLAVKLGLPEKALRFGGAAVAGAGAMMLFGA